MGGTGFLSRLRERHKTGKYKWQTDLINYSFISAGMEDGGAMGPGFKDMVNHFCRRGGDPSAEGLNWSAPTVKALFYQRLSCLVQRGFAKVVGTLAVKLREDRAKLPSVPLIHLSTHAARQEVSTSFGLPEAEAGVVSSPREVLSSVLREPDPDGIQTSQNSS